MSYFLLTHGEGVAHKFEPGDPRILLKGFTGPWENTTSMSQELFVIETKTYQEDMQRLME